MSMKEIDKENAKKTIATRDNVYTLHTRTMLNILFIFNVITGDIGSTFLIHNITFNFPQHPSWHFSPLFIKKFRSN